MDLLAGGGGGGDIGGLNYKLKPDHKKTQKPI